MNKQKDMKFKESKYSNIIKQYLLVKLTLPISKETILIDENIKSLNRIREFKKLNQILSLIDYNIEKFLKK